MNIKKALEPKDVEEVKPGLFVKKEGNGYRQVSPLVWKGEWKLRGQFNWRNLLMIIIILGLFFTGLKYVEFYQEVNENPKEFCKNITLADYQTYEVTNEYTSSISSYSGEG